MAADPDLLTIVFGLVSLSVGYPLARALSTRIERRAITNEDTQEIRRRLDAIEGAVDTIAVEVERMAEAQRFTARLLSERQVDAPRVSPPRAAGSITPH